MANRNASSDGDSQIRRRPWMILSPVAVILAMQIAARLLGPRIGVWSWIPLNLLYWLIILGLVWAGAGRQGVSGWLRRSGGGRIWPILAVGFGVLPTLPMLIPNAGLLLQPNVWITTLLFASFNPVAEEFYWRGLILGAFRPSRRAAATVFSAALFTVNHQWIAVNVAGARHPAAVAFQFVFGVVMGIVYVRTGSLRWPLLAHFLTNVLTITSAVFLGFYVPGK